MQNEQAKTIEVLHTAIQMEVDGKEFYRKASQKSSNKLAKELFLELASEEDVHRRRFVEVYEALKRGQNWPDVEPPSYNEQKLKSLFAEATEVLGGKSRVAESELEAIKIAMDMESKSYKLYHRRSKESTFPVERRFYETLADAEQGHHLTLFTSYEYLSDPVGWFTKTEHLSVE